MKRTIDLTTRQKAMAELAETRFGPGSEPISRFTLWRWCQACCVASGLDVFLPHETDRLHEVARLLSQGVGLKEIPQYFQETN